MKRILACSAVFVAVCAAMLACLLALNDDTVVLQQKGKVDAALADRGCVLSGWTADDGSETFVFQLDIEDDAPALSLAVANVFSFDLYCNGEPIYRYSDDEPSARLKLVELPEVSGSTALEIRFEEPQSTVRAQLGSAAQMLSANELGALLFSFCLGVLCLMLLYCLSLWFQKPDETILVYMIALILLVAARDVTQPFPLVAQSIPTYLKPGLNIALAFGMTLLSARYMFPGFFARHRGSTLPALVLLAVSVLICYVAQGSAKTVVFMSQYVVYHALCAAIVVYGCANRISGSWAMLFGLAFAVCSFAFYTAVDQALLPAGALAVQGYVIQLYNIPFLLACMVAINGRFVGYYRQLKKINAELDAMVEDRVEELRLQESQKHQLMTNVFHDLRTPLFVAKGCTEKLRERCGEERALAVLKDRLGFMDQLTQDLFAIAKLESGDMFLAEDAVDLSVLCERQVASCEIAAGEKSIRLSSRIVPGCKVWGDEHRIAQVLQNLLSNAVAHTPEAGSIALSMEKRGEDILVHVSDTGSGISEKEAAMVFDRYYRTESGGSNGSSGLGLAIVREIMKAHHGEAYVESSLGEGSVFTVSFPLLPEAASEK